MLSYFLRRHFCFFFRGYMIFKKIVLLSILCLSTFACGMDLRQEACVGQREIVLCMHSCDMCPMAFATLHNLIRHKCEEHQAKHFKKKQRQAAARNAKKGNSSEKKTGAIIACGKQAKRKRSESDSGEGYSYIGESKENLVPNQEIKRPRMQFDPRMLAALTIDGSEPDSSEADDFQQGDVGICGLTRSMGSLNLAELAGDGL
jgi:hypothetical protein